MYRKILVPLDGSSVSEYAIPFAVETARRSTGSVTLLRALPESLLVIGLPVSLEAAAERAARRETEKMAKTWAEKGVRIEIDIRIGLAAETILEASRQADLVVMSTHGDGGLRRMIMGSVTDKVIRLSPKPVLAIHPPAKYTTASAKAAATNMFRDIVVPLDGSPVAARALRELGQFADGGTLLHLVHAVARDASQPAIDLAQNDLKDTASPLEARGITLVMSVERNNSPAEAILDYAERKHCGVIAMTTRGASGLERWMLGGITDKIVRHGPTPVLVIRAAKVLWKGSKGAPKKKSRIKVLL